MSEFLDLPEAIRRFVHDDQTVALLVEGAAGPVGVVVAARQVAKDKLLTFNEPPE